MKYKITILGHRGLNRNTSDFYTESSFEAFQEHLSRGFGVECDVNFTKDKEIIFFHDSGLERITGSKDKRLFKDITSKEIKKIKLPLGRICFLKELFDMIANSKAEINALHLKSEFQENEYLEILLKELKKNEKIWQKIFIFDIKPKSAKYINGKNPYLSLAPLVSHKYDIERYNTVTGGTLISLIEALENRNIYNWVWMDEWDKNDKNGAGKTFYNIENFKALRKQRFKIAVVSPELHHTYPGLMRKESHQDAADMESLFKRIKEIINLKPDAICTDYPDLIKNIL